MSEILTLSFLIPLFTAGVRMSAPLIFGAAGNIMNERSGVMNIGLEGEMLISALTSFMVAERTGSLLIGVLSGGITGMLCALLIAFWSVSRKQDQSVVGIMFNIFALGFTNFLYRAVYGISTSKAKVSILREVHIPLLSKIPILGDILFRQNILVYLAFILSILIWLLLTHTKFGWQVQAVGENPKAAAAAGVSVIGIRYISYLFSGFMAGIGGSFLSCGIVGTFTENMTSGRGFICLAITILARWNPVYAIFASLLFGTTEALQLRLQALGASLPYQFFVALPFIVTLAALVIFGRNIRAPKSLGAIYTKESR